MKTAFSLFSAILLCTLSSLESQAGTLDDIGFTDLKLELGSALPDGSSISVTQVEAPVSVACVPNTALAEFNLITFNDYTLGVTGCTDGLASGHATSVAQKFFGAVTSASTAIGSVDLFETNNWLFSGFLNTYAVNPGISATRLANHSWVGNHPDANVNIDILRRVDFVVEQDEFVQVVAMVPNPTTTHLLSDSLNAIVVGLSKGSSSGTTALSSIYTAGRTRPDIVAPESTVSSASPRAASAAALLMDYAHTNPLLSNGSTSNRDNIITIYNAERSETIKAILMAGADRNTVGNTNSIDITNYRVDVANQTNNGLDRRFGAGQINVYNSYHILAAGEQNSAEDGGIIFANTGFDYDPSFGGLNGSNATATYSFTTSAIGGQKIKAALVWNLDVLTISTDKLYNLDLQLIDVTGGNAIVASSTSTIDNTENIWVDLASNNEYQLKVIRSSGQTDFNWDYALAWQISTLPVVTAGQVFSIDENSTPTTVIGAVTATVPTGTITKYAIFSGNTGNVFAISNSGVLTVAGAIDYETTASYSLGIVATDGLNVSNAEMVVVNVIDINDVAPIVEALQTLNVDENSPVGASVATVVADDVDSAITGFTIEGGSAVFAIDSSGLITVTGALDYETTPSYTLSITATDGINTSGAVDVVININNLDEVAPTVTAAQIFSIDENSANGTLVGTVIATDAADADGIVSGFDIVSGNTGNVFAIASNGVITVAGAVDYEIATSYTLGVTATDDSGNTSSAVNVVINVNDLNDMAPVISLLQTFSINENSANGTAVGTVIATDVDSAITGFNISGGNTGNVFSIAANGAITVAAAVDYETTPSYTLSITATDGVNTSVPVDILISVNDLNDVAPVVTASQTLNIDENSIVGASVGAVVAGDVDSAITGFTIENGSTVFAIDSSGLIMVIGILDYEAAPSYTLSITATDGISTSGAVDVVININNLDEVAPTVTAAQNFSIDENSANGTLVGTVVATDAADAGGVVSGFNIVSGNTGNVFAIASNGAITVAGVVDYETTASYTLGVTATDDSGNTSGVVDVVININDFDEIAPVIGASQSFSVDENAANATVVGMVSATDAAGIISGFDIVSGNTGNVFAIASNGAISVAGAVDYETTASYTLGVTATDDSGNTSGVVNVVITINDIVESSASTSSGGGGSLSLMWLLLPLFITAGRRRVS